MNDYTKNPPPGHFTTIEGGAATVRTSVHTGWMNIRRAPARLRQPKSRMRLAVRGVPMGALCTHAP